MSRDWFRKTSWTAEDQADFRRRLARVRTQKRPQYLRIQAVTLEEQGLSQLTAAVALFDEVIADYPDSFDFLWAVEMKGKCLERLGRIEDALESYLLAISRMKSFPNRQIGAPLDFAWLVATKQLSKHYENALEILTALSGEMIFPASRFKYHGSRALILNALGRSDAAIDEASMALAAADQQTSGLRYHARLGLVDDGALAERSVLAKIANRAN